MNIGLASARFVPLCLLACFTLAGAPTSVVADDDDAKTASAETASDEADDAKERGRVIVKSARAAVQLQDAEPKAIPPGSVFNYSIVNGPWIWSDRHWGWVKRDQTVEIDEAIEYFTDIYKAGLATDSPEGKRDAAIALHHRGISKLALGDPEAALEDFEQANDAGLKSGQLQLNRANAYRELGEYDKALEAATEGIRLNPDSSQAHDIRAGVLFAQEQYDASLQDSNTAVKLDDQNAEALNNRGVTKRVLGQWREAAADYTKALKIAPRHPQALANRGYVLKKLGRFKEAARDYQRALKVNPNEAVVYNDLAWLLATCGEKDIRSPAEAIKYAKKAVELDPEEGHYLDTLAAAYAANGDFEQATETGLEAVKRLEEAEQYEADQRVSLYIEKKPYVEK